MKRLSLVMLVMMMSAGTATAQVKLTTEDAPPFNMLKDGKVVGSATEILRAVFAKAGVSYTVEVLPWKRAYQSALDDKSTCVYSTTETEDRRALFEWVGPLVEDNWTLFARANTNLKPSKLEDVKSLKIGGYAGDATAEFLTAAGYTVETAPRDEVNVRKLAEGRIDVWATGSSSGPFIAESEGMKDLKAVLTFRNVVLSLACNKALDPVILGKLRTALQDVRSGK